MKLRFEKTERLNFNVHDEDSNDEFVGLAKLWRDSSGYWLNGVNVFIPRKRYGTGIINYLSKNYKPFIVSLSDSDFHFSKNQKDCRALMPSGFELVKYCFNEGILGYDNFKTPDSNRIVEQYKSEPFLERLKRPSDNK